MIDRVVLLDEAQRRLVVEVGPLATHRLMRSGKHVDRFAAAVTPLLPTGHAPLALGQVPFSSAVVVGMVDHGPVGQGGKRLKTQVEARRLSGG